MEVSRDWKRYEFTFVVEHLVSQGVADLVVGGKGPGKAWVDAVQLEAGTAGFRVPDALSGGSGAGGAPQAAHAPFGG